MKKHNVFISWSGERSKIIAEAFFEWLPMVIQSAKPWMSGLSIDKGSRSLVEIAKALDGIKLGITFLTPENLEEPWILYEAGCLTKTVDEKTYLCTYLLDGLQNEDVKQPLGQFQHTQPKKDDTRRLVRTINKAISEDEPIPEKTLDAVFERLWPDLESKINALPAASKAVAKRPLEDMVAEILEFTRTETNSRSRSITFTSGGVPVLGNTSGGVQIYGSSNLLPEFDWNTPQGEVQISNNIFRDRVSGRGIVPVPPKDDDGNEHD